MTKYRNRLVGSDIDILEIHVCPKTTTKCPSVLISLARVTQVTIVTAETQGYLFRYLG